ncbi:MAG: formyltransferase family protein [Gammaproteobacteria bacterium]
MQRIVVFVSNVGNVPSILVRGAITAVESMDNAQLAAICLTDPLNYPAIRRRYYLRRANRALRSLVSSDARMRPRLAEPVDLVRLGRRYGFDLISPDKDDINSPAFIRKLRTEIKPTMALSFFCVKRFRDELLNTFQHAINYHNGLLPRYKGLGSTSWSIYRGEAETGFTFHLMTNQLDCGAVLYEESFPITLGRRVPDLEIDKARLAAERLPEVLNLAVSGFPGHDQTAEGNYYSRADRDAIKRIANPGDLSAKELIRRAWAFDGLEMRLNERWYSVSGVVPAPDRALGRNRLCFRTADGAVMRATRTFYRRIEDALRFSGLLD